MASWRRALGWPVDPVERLQWRLRDWRWRGPCGCESVISNTVGGLDRRSRAAAYGRAASIISRVSGRVARCSSGHTIPGLFLLASLASLWGLVIDSLEGSPEKGLVEGC